MALSLARIRWLYQRCPAAQCRLMADGPPPEHPPPPPPWGFPPPGHGYPPPPGSPPSGYPPPPGSGYPPPPWGYPGQPVLGWNPGRPPSQVGSGRFRSMSVGELLDATFSLYRRNFVLIAAISAIVQVPYSLLQFVVFQLLGYSALQGRLRAAEQALQNPNQAPTTEHVQNV